MRQCGRLRTNVVAIGVFAAMRRALETMSWPLSARIMDVCLPWVYLNGVRQCGSSNNWYSLSRRPPTMSMNIFNKQMISQSKFEIPRSPSEMRPTPTNRWWRYLRQVTVPTERYAIQTYEQVDRPGRRRSSPRIVKSYGVCSSPPNCPPRQ